MNRTMPQPKRSTRGRWFISVALLTLALIAGVCWWLAHRPFPIEEAFDRIEVGMPLNEARAIAGDEGVWPLARQKAGPVTIELWKDYLNEMMEIRYADERITRKELLGIGLRPWDRLRVWLRQ